jgi:hypothetical protein
MRKYIALTAKNWHNAWHDKAFRERLIFAVIAIIIIAFITHYFFDYNEGRKGGVVMNDWVLQELPADNVSIPITLFMSSVVLLFLFRTIVNPVMFITALIAYTLLLAFRIITIAITHFQTPPELIELHDPISDLVYGSKFITKDLFFSGHVATIFLVYLCLYKKTDKYYLLFAAFSIGLLVLIQHVHYTIDVLCAPFFALGSVWLSKKMIHLHYARVHSL